MTRHLVDRGECSVVYLLRAANLIKLDYFHGLRIIEITERRIDEGQMTILANAQHPEVGRVSRQQFAIAFGFNGPIVCVATQPVKRAHWHLADQAIDEKTPERLGCSLIH